MTVFRNDSLQKGLFEGVTVWRSDWLQKWLSSGVTVFRTEVPVLRYDCFQKWLNIFRSDCPKERHPDDPKGRYLSLAIIYLAPSSQISAMFEQLLKGQLSWKCDEEVQVQNSRTTWCWGAKVVVKFGRVSQCSSTEHVYNPQKPAARYGTAQKWTQQCFSLCQTEKE